MIFFALLLVGLCLGLVTVVAHLARRDTKAALEEARRLLREDLEDPRDHH